MDFGEHFLMGNTLFILISGYFFIETKFKIQKLFGLYVPIYFYSVVFALVALLLGIGLKSEWKRVLFPVINSEYWFATIYIVLYCLIPYIKLFIQNLGKRQYSLLLLLLLTLFSIIPTVFQKESWLNTGGIFGIAWFIFAYLIGAYIRVYNKSRLPIKIRVVIFVFAIMVAPIYRFMIDVRENVHWFLKGYVTTLYEGDSMFILLASVMLMLIFVDVDIKNIKCKRCINYLGAGCFGVYLIHNNRNIAHFIWEKLKVHYWIVEKGNVLMALLIGLMVFLICNIAEHLRKSIFKLLRIDDLLFELSNKIEKICSRWLINENFDSK